MYVWYFTFSLANANICCIHNAVLYLCRCNADFSDDLIGLKIQVEKRHS